MLTSQRATLFVLGLFLFLYIAPLGMRPLFVPDETRYAEVPREMIVSGDWITPHLNGMRYFEKPVLGYWLNAVSIMTFGENNFAVRLPSALAAGFSALFIFLLARREKDRFIAPLAAFIFLTCAEVAVVGTFAVLDVILTCFLTASLFFFYRALTASKGSSQEKKMLAAAGVCCGLAFLTKGFLAFVVPGLTVFGFLVWQRRFADLLRMAWLPILTAGIIIAPWAFAIHGQEPDFWNYFFWEEHVRRFLGGDHAQHKESFWFFFITAPAMVFPWLLFAPVAVSGLRKSAPSGSVDQNKNLLPFLLCWLVLPFLFFALSSGKLLTYILPCIPPFALLAAIGLRRYFDNTSQRLFSWATGGAASLAGLLLIVFLWAQFIGLGHNALRPYSETWKWLMVATGFIAMLLFFIASRQCRDGYVKLFCFGAAPVLLLFSLQFAMPDLTLEKKAPGALLERHLHDIQPESLILADDDSIRAVCWYLKRDDIFLLNGRGELAYGIEHGGTGRMLSLEKASDLIKHNPDRVIIIARQRHFEKWRDHLPAPLFRDDNGKKGYIFVKF